MTLTGLLDASDYRLRALLFYHKLGAGCWVTGSIRPYRHGSLVSAEIQLTTIEFLAGVMGLLTPPLLFAYGEPVGFAFAFFVFPAFAAFDLWLISRLVRLRFTSALL
jgi:hypothetical protein